MNMQKTNNILHKNGRNELKINNGKDKNSLQFVYKTTLFISKMF